MDYRKYKAAAAATLICCFLLFCFGDCLNSNDGHYDPPGNSESETWIGIVLGADYYSVSVFEHGTVKIIPNQYGNLKTPSCVAFTDHPGEEVLIGEPAKNQSHLNPERTICDATRLIGTMFGDDEVQRDITTLPYKIIDKDGEPYVEVKLIRDGDETVMAYSPEEISAMLLRRMKELAEAYLGRRKIDGAAIIVPAYFTNKQIDEVIYAASEAGIYVPLNVIVEQLAVFPCYMSLEEALTRDDDNLQGKNYLVFNIGTSRVDVSVLNWDGVYLRGTRGDNHLGVGGIDIDQKIMLNATKEDRDILIQNNEALLFRKITQLVKGVLEDAELKRPDIDVLLIVGGSSMPSVRQMLADYFDGKEPLEAENPDEVLAHGAAIAGLLSAGYKRERTVRQSLGIETAGGTMTKIVEEGDRFPVRKSEMFTTTLDNQTAVSIKVYISNRWNEGSRRFQRFERSGNQCYVANERWRLIGILELSGIELAPRGIARIEVTFSIDAAVPSLVHVMAKDELSNKTEAISINKLVSRRKGKVGRNIREPHEDEKIIIPVTNLETDSIPCIPKRYRTYGINRPLVRSPMGVFDSQG